MSYNRKYYLNNREKIKEKVKEYQRKNKKKVKEYQREYYENHIEYFREYMKKYNGKSQKDYINEREKVCEFNLRKLLE